MFDTLLLLLVPLLVLRLLGAVGAQRFATWRASAAHALAVMLVLTAAAHFAPGGVTVMPGTDDLVAMVPPWVPFPRLTVYATGVLELAGAVGLVIAASRAAAGVCLAALFVLMLPANVHAALENVPLNGDPATPLWFRLPEQALYIAVALWSSRASGDSPPGRARRRVSGA